MDQPAFKAFGIFIRNNTANDNRNMAQISITHAIHQIFDQRNANTCASSSIAAATNSSGVRRIPHRNIHATITCAYGNLFRAVRMAIKARFATRNFKRRPKRSLTASTLSRKSSKPSVGLTVRRQHLLVRDIPHARCAFARPIHGCNSCFGCSDGRLITLRPSAAALRKISKGGINGT
ncbi:MeaA [Caligus rogercresseyi]|uniref:MeaA n=1 Tax=Caligus rogercresseyi TaxID=217165 RepID=A0A7T8H1H7_CALRO|nr:MeaA [Caligus rogercresseyi]